MRIALCQLNPTVGACEANVDLVLEALREAREQGAQLAVFSELVVPGYPPLDLVERPSFVDACLAAEDRLVAEMPEGLTAVFGNLRRTTGGVGRALQNVAVAARRGERQGEFAKTLLPTYDVFDEARYFQPRRNHDPALVTVAGRKVGITVCEDLWNDEILWRDSSVLRDDSPGARRAYDRDPVEELRHAGAEIIVNLSASPWNRGKLDVRERIVTHAARRHGVFCLYVNAVGGNDGLVFDGHSLAANPRGELIHRAPGWSSSTTVLSLDDAPPQLSAVGTDDEEIREALVLGIRDYFGKTGIKGAIIGLSGGIDSAVTATLAVRALGPDRVTGVGMPSAISSDHSVEDARQLAAHLGIEFRLVPIAPAVEAFEGLLAPTFEGLPRDVTEENLQSRIRGVTLMAIANKTNGVILGTGNKSEAAMGYATLYGDTIGALSVLADLYKHQVYAQAQLANRDGEVVPQRTIDKPPSAELRPGQKDSDSLPDYDLLDAVLELFIEHRLGIEAIAERTSASADLVRSIVGKVYFNEFKRKQLPPTIRVCRKAWVGRVYPIVQRFRS